MNSRVAVGGVGRVELVAIAYPTEVLVGADRILDRKRIISCYAKDVLYANLVQAGEDVLYDRVQRGRTT
jgi:hypothetical protein